MDQLVVKSDKGNKPGSQAPADAEYQARVKRLQAYHEGKPNE